MKVTEERILDGTSELFSRIGFSRVTVDEISRYLGISKKTIYNHFPTKDRLVREVFERSIGNFLENLENLANQRSKDFMTRIREIVEYAVEELSSRFKPLIEDMRAGERELRGTLFPKIRSKLCSLIKRLLWEGREQGFVRRDGQDEVLPYVYLTMIEGVIKQNRDSEIPLEVGELLQASLRLSFFGVLTEEGQSAYLKKEE